MSIRIFLPLHMRGCSSSSVLVGWKFEATDGAKVFVVAAKCDVPGQPSEAFGHAEAAAVGQILGKKRVEEDVDLVKETLTGQGWIVLDWDLNAKLPMLHSFIDGNNKSIAQPSAEFYFYKQPRSIALQYMSLDPLILDLSVARSLMPTNSHSQMSHNNHRRKLSPHDAKMEQNMMAHLFPHGTSRANHTRRGSSGDLLAQPTKRASDLAVVLDKINHCYNVESKIMNPSTRRILEEAYSYYETAWIIAYTILRYPVMAPITFLVFLARVIAEVGLWILNSNTNVSGVALKDVSTFGYQINLRLQQACFWPWQYAEWRNSQQKLSPLCQAQYIGFYNTVWLIVNDIILGLTLGGFLMTNSNILALQFLSLCDYFTQDGITVVIDWLMGWPPPAGLKLNSELNGFLGQLFLWILQIWKESMVPLRASLPYVIYTIGFAGHFGATISLSLLSDLVAAFTMHLYLFYVVAAKIYSWQVDAILSLLTIFRGKKMNVLRNRVDNAEFDLDQLLVGTILFTLLVFLFPTVAVYYLLFTLTRVGVVLIQGVFEVMLAFLNHFPLFAIMLRIKEPSRLPAGVKFTLLKPTKSAHGTVYLKMDNVPIGISTIFYQYIYIVDRLVTYYLTSAMTKSFFSGRAIPRVPRLQYPTLPERDFERFPNLKEVWDYFLTCF